MNPPASSHRLVPIAFVALGIALGAAGIYVGDTDDSPGAALLGPLLMLGLFALGGRTARRQRQTRLGHR